LRPYIARVSNVGVIFETDSEFGDISTPPNDTDRLNDDNLKPSEKLPPEKLAHLTLEQCQKLLELLDGYPECFSDRPGYCDLLCHEIKLKPNFVPKQSKV